MFFSLFIFFMLNTTMLHLFLAASVVTCPDPGNVEHSRKVITGTRFAVGASVQFICNKGYVLSGNSLLTCYNRDSAKPKWSERLPKCVRKSMEEGVEMSLQCQKRTSAALLRLWDLSCCRSSLQLRSTSRAGILARLPPACRTMRRPSTRPARR